MKTLIAVLIAVASCALRPMPTFASVTADLTLTETGGKLLAKVSLKGIADCPTSGSITIHFESPNPKVVVSSDYEAPWRSCSKYVDDDGAVGTARTWAYRTVRRSDHLSCKGTWHVTVKSGGKVLAEGDYTVE